MTTIPELHVSGLREGEAPTFQLQPIGPGTGPSAVYLDLRDFLALSSILDPALARDKPVELASSCARPSCPLPKTQSPKRAASNLRHGPPPGPAIARDRNQGAAPMSHEQFTLPFLDTTSRRPRPLRRFLGAQGEPAGGNRPRAGSRRSARRRSGARLPARRRPQARARLEGAGGRQSRGHQPRDPDRSRGPPRPAGPRRLSRRPARHSPERRPNTIGRRSLSFGAL